VNIYTSNVLSFAAKPNNHCIAKHMHKWVTLSFRLNQVLNY